MSSSCLVAVLCLAGLASAAGPGSARGGRDLAMYVSRPDIRAPRLAFNITKPDAVAPGYWFITTDSTAESISDDASFTPYQLGPHILDSDGELIWSGAPMAAGRVAQDFKVAQVNGSSHLAFSVFTDSPRTRYPNGTAVLLDSAYSVKQQILNRAGDDARMDMREFNIIAGGKSALTTAHRNQSIQIPSDQEVGEMRSQIVDDNGFREIDLRTGQTLFEWWPLKHLDPFDSNVQAPTDHVADYPWDFFHANSVDKDAAGDYLVSSRSMSAIYKISGKTGAVLWQLGGKRSQFAFGDNVKFAYQHDARFLSSSKHSTVISMLNNFAVHSATGPVKNYSTAQIIRLDTASMIAHQNLEISRPDGFTSRFRGSFQSLPAGNRVIGWSGNGLLTEHNSDGDVVLQGRFTSDRFTTYSAYKYPWTGAPVEDPALVAVRFGEEDPSSQPLAAPVGKTPKKSKKQSPVVPPPAPRKDVVVAYVSWNGATEVDRWQFFSRGQGAPGEYQLAGDVSRKGFETECVMHGDIASVYARAVSATGQVLSTTEPVAVRMGFNGGDDAGASAGQKVTAVVGKAAKAAKAKAKARPVVFEAQPAKKQSRFYSLLLLLMGAGIGYVFALYK